MRPPRLAALCLALGIAGAATGCGCGESGPELLVTLKTDLRPALDFAVVQTTVFQGGVEDERSGRQRTERTDADAGQRFFAGERVAQLGGLPEGQHGVRVRLRDRDNAVVAERLVLIDVRGTTLVTVVITSDCAGVVCPAPGGDPAAITCFGGRCVPPECGGSAATVCPEAECIADAECSAPPCATARCADGVCLAETDPTRCGPGLSCHPADGCVPLAMDGDAGVDAAMPPPDASCGPCDDGNPCTDDLCGAAGCAHVPNAGVCDDGVFCNGADGCGGGSCSVHAGDPCGAPTTCDEGANACAGECRDDATCPPRADGPWSGCAFDDVCDETGVERRTVTTWHCRSGTCARSVAEETRACARDTDGFECAPDDVGAWSDCAYEGVCDQDGTRARTVAPQRCTGGACRGSPRTETEACARSTDGTVCESGGTYCGTPMSCRICRGGGCVTNAPHYDDACRPSCGVSRDLCGSAAAMCCPFFAACPGGTIGPGPWSDCGTCCAGASCG